MARFLGALVLCLAVAVFAVENDQAVSLRFAGMTAPAVHLAFLVLGALVLGAAVTVLLGGLQVLRLRRHVAGLERNLEAVQADLGLARAQLDGHGPATALPAPDDGAAGCQPESGDATPEATEHDGESPAPPRPPD